MNPLSRVAITFSAEDVTPERITQLIVQAATRLVNSVNTWIDHPTYNTAPALRAELAELHGMHQLALALNRYNQLPNAIDFAVQDAIRAVNGAINERGCKVPSSQMTRHSMSSYSSLQKDATE